MKAMFDMMWFHKKQKDIASAAKYALSNPSKMKGECKCKTKMN